MTAADIQSLFFQHLKSVLPPHVSMVDEVAETLGISVDSAYRRIRNEKPISLEELGKICIRFKISLDKLIHLQDDSFLFWGHLANSSGFSFEQYLGDILRQLELMNSFSAKHMYFLVKDIPPMAHFLIPELTAFRCFFWNKSILLDESYKRKKFSVTEFVPEQIELAKKIIHVHCKIPGTEIWNIESINSTLRQMQFYKEAGVFTKDEDYEILLSKVELLINHLERQAELGLKFQVDEAPAADAASYRLMHNELILGDNTIFCELGDTKITYITHSVINFMATKDAVFNDHMQSALKNLINKSIQISTVGEKERLRFFNALRKKIRQPMLA